MPAGHSKGSQIEIDLRPFSISSMPPASGIPHYDQDGKTGDHGDNAPIGPFGLGNHEALCGIWEIAGPLPDPEQADEDQQPSKNP
jgi:hypothetical protein